MSETITPDQLTTWRVKYNFSQRRLAEELGMKTGQISRYERGLSPIPRTVALALDSVARLLIESNLSAAMRARSERTCMGLMTGDQPS